MAVVAEVSWRQRRVRRRAVLALCRQAPSASSAAASPQSHHEIEPAQPVLTTRGLGLMDGHPQTLDASSSAWP